MESEKTKQKKTKYTILYTLLHWSQTKHSNEASTFNVVSKTYSDLDLAALTECFMFDQRTDAWKVVNTKCNITV